MATSKQEAAIKKLKSDQLQNRLRESLDDNNLDIEELHYVVNPEASEYQKQGKKAKGIRKSYLRDIKTLGLQMKSLAPWGSEEYYNFITKAPFDEKNKANKWLTLGEKRKSRKGLNELISKKPKMANQILERVGKWISGIDYPEPKAEGDAANNIDLKGVEIEWTTSDENAPLFKTDASGKPVVKWSDINQGKLGSCWLLSSLASIADNNPDKIKEMIIDNGNETYGVRFFDDDKNLFGLR